MIHHSHMCTVGSVLFLCQPVLLHKHHSAQFCDATRSTATTLQPLRWNNTQVCTCICIQYTVNATSWLYVCVRRVAGLYMLTTHVHMTTSCRVHKRGRVQVHMHDSVHTYIHVYFLEHTTKRYSCTTTHCAPMKCQMLEQTLNVMYTIQQSLYMQILPCTVIYLHDITMTSFPPLPLIQVISDSIGRLGMSGGLQGCSASSSGQAVLHPGHPSNPSPSTSTGQPHSCSAPQ